MVSLKLIITVLVAISISSSRYVKVLGKVSSRVSKHSVENGTVAPQYEESLNESIKEYISKPMDACKVLLLDAFYIGDLMAKLSFSNAYSRLTSLILDQKFAPIADESTEDRRYREFKKELYMKCFNYILEKNIVDFSKEPTPKTHCHDTATNEFKNLDLNLKEDVKDLEGLENLCIVILKEIGGIENPNTATANETFETFYNKMSEFHVTFNDLYNSSEDHGPLNRVMEELLKNRTVDEKPQTEYTETDIRILDVYLQLFLVSYFELFKKAILDYDDSANAFKNMASFCRDVGIPFMNENKIKVPKSEAKKIGISEKMAAMP